MRRRLRVTLRTELRCYPSVSARSYPYNDCSKWEKRKREKRKEERKKEKTIYHLDVISRFDEAAARARIESLISGMDDFNSSVQPYKSQRASRLLDRRQSKSRKYRRIFPLSPFLPLFSVAEVSFYSGRRTVVPTGTFVCIYI